MTSSRPPLRGHTAVQTRDVDAAEQTLSRCFLPLRLRQRPGTAFRTEVHSIALGEVTVGAVRFENEVGIRTAAAENFHVDVPLSGRAVSGVGSHREVVTTPGSAQVFMPGEPADLRWSDSMRQLCVMVEKPALERQLSTLLGAELTRPLRFRTVMDLRSPGGSTWMHAVRLVERQLPRDDGLLGHGMTRRTLDRLIMESLLLGQQHNYSRELHRLPAAGGSSAVRTAIDLLEAHPERPWTAGLLAAEVGLSVRALHAGFRNATEVAPMTYLRQTRLARAHEELLHADPASTTVRAVAYRWGFAHLGRFAGTYAERYGRSPSTTLKGRR